MIDQTVSNLDWFPTLASIGGASLPLEEPIIRGRNFLPLLRGTSAEWDNDLFAQYAMREGHQTGADLRTYRTPQWKLVRDFKHEDKDELYNLASDPDEAHDLIQCRDAAIRNIRDSLNEKLMERMAHIDDPALRSSL